MRIQVHLLKILTCIALIAKYFLLFFTAERKVFCAFKRDYSEYLGRFIATCGIHPKIGNERFVLATRVNATIKYFMVIENKRLKFLPRDIGKKLPNLKDFNVWECGLIFVRNHYFRDMKKLRCLTLSYNRIAAVESDSFVDLVSLEALHLEGNRIKTFDKNIFAKMASLREIFLYDNRIKFLSASTFKIPFGNLELVALSSNVCINSWYTKFANFRSLEYLESDLKARCTRTSLFDFLMRESM